LRGPLTLEVRQQIWHDYTEKKPNYGAAFDQWAQELSERLEVPAVKIRRTIAAQHNASQLAVRQNQTTTAMQVAQMIGAGLELAVGTILSGLKATRKDILYEDHIVMVEEPESHEENHTGEIDTYKKTRKLDRTKALRIRRPQLNADGSIKYFEQADWKNRLGAAEQLIDIWGGKAPEKHEINVDHKHMVVNLSDEDLRAAIENVRKEIAAIEAGTSGDTQESAGTSQRKKGKRSPQELLLLADGVHEDAGRAGHNGQPVQTFSQAPVHRPPSGRS
jgi:hypothetical protein